ncbi:37 kDa salivary gland allergen Aed a 2-like isoform X2 [Sabethes cyaneus]|uniref:37 kDa salivary gland allergen Aed a 2-like isoform X2 n=1 Tax=Sabethes cyaneus TaxID=53552 RepID=UPI00237E0333|nr:37 kDa salivary gland allergen Aed a 2-like isoform X2 [Sabethes cyaneus]
MISPTLILVFLIVVTATVAWNPMDPEQTFFVYGRCMDDFLKQASNPLQAFANWFNWKLEPAEDPATQCYTKCILEGLGLYDGMSKKFKPNRIRQQWKAYKEYNFVDEKSVGAYANAVKNAPKADDGSCKAVFTAYKQIHLDYLQTMARGNRIKQPKESYFAFCENRHYKSNREAICQIRNYAVFEDAIFKNHMLCIFQGLRYFTPNDEINIPEIARDFEEIGKQSTELQKVLKECSTSKPRDAPSKALHYYKCLLTSSVRNDFKEAFDYRELRTACYFYSFYPQRKIYSKEEVAEKINAINKAQCPE